MSDTYENKIKENGYINDKVICVTNRHLSEKSLARQVEIVCKFHPKAIILREKDLPEDEYMTLANEILDICKKNNVKCILHFYPNVAKKLKCNAIHLPLFKLRENRANLSEFKIIGTSVHSVEEAIEAQNLGATYISAGHIFATDCKKGVPPRGLEFLKEVCQAVNIPVYAIGGIKLSDEQIKLITDCGAAGGCIMSGTMKLKSENMA
ncbi:MAG: thiamine phosphate synthase [Eubacterium sp.]|uniref:thiamine phosphate synthase n=1 Tax=Eubacterium sp. TaxID=142586 RepID=UPI00300F25B4